MPSLDRAWIIRSPTHKSFIRFGEEKPLKSYRDSEMHEANKEERIRRFCHEEMVVAISAGR